MGGRGRRQAMAWEGQIVDSSIDSDDDTLPYNWASGRGAVADQQRRQSPGLQTCQAGLEAEDAAKPLGHPSLGSDPQSQNILLKWFMSNLLENQLLVQMPPTSRSVFLSSESV